MMLRFQGCLRGQGLFSRACERILLSGRLSVYMGVSQLVWRADNAAIGSLNERFREDVPTGMTER